MTSNCKIIALLVLGASLGSTQVIAPAAVHNTGFNSTFKLTATQIEAAQLDEVLVENIQIITNFETTQLAFGGPHEDEFYKLLSFTNDTIPTEPGQILKVQLYTNVTEYSLPPNTAMSRIMYTTTTFNGTVVPATGFVLWPYTARKVAARNTTAASAVLWLHGTSSFFAPHSPSSHRGLWYDHSGPFALAQAGYAVFAPDYAGLGVRASWDGSEIAHQYSTYPATAHDALYGLRAALEALPNVLDNNYVVMGHSQGGGAAWALAGTLVREEQDFQDLLAGYRGVIPAAPGTDPVAGPPTFMLPTVGQGLSSIFPSFELEHWLAPLGVARVELARELEAGNGVCQQLFMSLTEEEMVGPDFRNGWYLEAFQKLASVARKDFMGPMLVIQGTDDPYIPYNITRGAVEDTWELFPDNDLELLVAEGVGHTPILSATKHIWLQWIDDRLDGKPLKNKGGVRTDLSPMLPSDKYLGVANSFPLWVGLPEYGYGVALSV